jgi:hypothetical protein
MESEKAQMDANDALADEAAAKADQLKQQLQQDINQVLPSALAVHNNAVQCLMQRLMTTAA